MEGKLWELKLPTSGLYAWFGFITLVISTSPTWIYVIYLSILFLFFRRTGTPLQATLTNNDFQIISLSDRILTQEEINLLREGLGFVTTTRFNLFLWAKDIDLFVRKLKWKKKFKQHARVRCAQLGLIEDDLPGEKA